LDKFFLIPNPWWIIGFICGEGSFTYGSSRSITAKFGYRIKYQLFFEIAQNTKDIYILQAILKFLGTGREAFRAELIISSVRIPLLFLSIGVSPLWKGGFAEQIKIKIESQKEKYLNLKLEI
jgi:hypothetical protein